MSNKSREFTTHAITRQGITAVPIKRLRDPGSVIAEALLSASVTSHVSLAQHERHSMRSADVQLMTHVPLHVPFALLPVYHARCR